MGDWLDIKPQFPRGMKPVLDEIRAAGFVPGLWIAPFLVGNRSRLYRDHPDWVVRDVATGGPLAAMTFYGEFRWHKRSEEYYVLDVTNPAAEAFIRAVFRTWRRDWGCGYFKTDFMHLGSAFGPDRAAWHGAGLTRIAIWMRMARLIREEIGDALWLGCGCPLWAPAGLVDGMRIGRDMGVAWGGERPAETLLRDQITRNFAHGILWQADPDCILLRDRFHGFTDREIEGLAILAGLMGGVTMTSDHLGELSAERLALWRFVVGDGKPARCDFPLLGRSDPVIVQIRQPDGARRGFLFVFNTADAVEERRYDLVSLGLAGRRVLATGPESAGAIASDGILALALPPHAWRLFEVRELDPPAWE
jgi:alpha-galactosidase